MRLSIIVIIYHSICQLPSINARLSPYQQEIRQYLHSLEAFTEKFANFYDSELRRIRQMKNLISRFQELRLAASSDEEAFLSNPLYSYLLIKSLTADLNCLDQNKIREAFQDSVKELLMPMEDELYEAEISFSWMQATKKDLDYAKEMFPIRLTAEDCHDLGLRAYRIANYQGALYWLERALTELDDYQFGSKIEFDSLKHIALAEEMEGLFKDAMKTTKELLNLDPDSKWGQSNIEHLEVVEKEGVKNVTRNKYEIVDYEEYKENLRDYAKLCKGESTRTIAEDSKLHCRYFTNENAYLLLQPLKEEELNLNPRIVLYRNVISEKEGRVMMYLSVNKLFVADVERDPNEKVQDTRISKCAWLRDSDHKSIARISQRIQDITGLSLESAEEMQVANYGIGGFYRLHPDFSDNNDKDNSTIVNEYDEVNGKRIATWLSYISDVKEGGFTVFPLVGAIVRPEKGSAVFWYNLHNNGSGNYQTVHAACPVLAGTKWIANKWLHERGQEFLKPCLAHQNQNS